MATSMQASFSGGELSPQLHARVDIAKHAVGLAKCENFIVHAHGGVSNRPGTQFVGKARDDATKCRLIPFQYNTEQTYCLEFGDKYLRVIKDGAHVVEHAPWTIAGIAQSNPAVVTVPGHTLAAGDTVYISGTDIAGMNDARYTVSAVTGDDVTVNFDASAAGPGSGGFAERVGVITGITKGGPTTPAIVTSAAHGLDSGNSVYINGSDLSEANGNRYRVTRLSDDTYSLQDRNGDDVSFSNSATSGFAERAVIVTGIDKTATPPVVTAPGHGLVTGDDVIIDGVLGMTELNGNQYKGNVLTDSTFALTDAISGENIDSATLTDWTSGGFVRPVYTVATPYGEADLPLLKYTQSADVMTICHPNHAVRDLSRANHDAWTLTSVAFAPRVPAPSSVEATPNGGPDETPHSYLKITNITKSASSGAATEVTLHKDHGFRLGDQIGISHAASDTSDTSLVDLLNRKHFLVGAIPATNKLNLHDLNNVPVNSLGVTGGYDVTNTPGRLEKNLYEYQVTAVDAGTLEESLTASVATARADLQTGTETIRLSWTAPAGARVSQYNVYRAVNGIFGYIGSTENDWFVDNNIEPVLNDTPPKARDPFVDETAAPVVRDDPGVVAYFEQRRIFARTNKNRQTIFASQTGNIANMSVSQPLKPDDAITFTLPSRVGGEIRHLIPMKGLFIFTSEDVWVSSSGNSAYTLETLKNDINTSNGASDIPPIVTDNTILYVQNKGNTVWDLAFSFENDSFTGRDVTILAPHIFERKTIVDWAYAQLPFSIVWVVLDDGTIAALSYVREHDVWAWHRHETDGAFESVCAIAEGAEDAVYFVVNRKFLNGNCEVVTRRYIERMHTRTFADVRDAFFVDSGLSLDKPFAITGFQNENPAVVTVPGHDFNEADLVDISDCEGATELNDVRYFVANPKANTFVLIEEYGGLQFSVTGVRREDPAVVKAPGHSFVAGDTVFVSDVLGAVEVNDRFFVVREVGIDGDPDLFSLKDLDNNDVRGVEWGLFAGAGSVRAVSPVDGSGLGCYLGGGLARKAETTLRGLDHLEGKEVSILANGNVEPRQTVVGGQVTLAGKAASRVHVGLPYTCDIETLDLNNQAGALGGKLRSISRVTMRLFRSRGFFVGPDESHLVEYRQRVGEDYNEPTTLLTEEMQIVVEPSWNGNGRVFVRQTDPLPLTVQSIAPEFEASDI